MINKKVKIIDTSTLVHDPSCLTYLMKKGVKACIPWIVLEELDGLKSRVDIGFDAREAIRNIEELRQANHPDLIISRNTDWENCDSVNRNKNDHIIIATANHLKKSFKSVEVVSKDTMMRIKTRELGIISEDYYRHQVEKDENQVISRLEISSKDIDFNDFTFRYNPDKHGKPLFNDCFVCVSDWDGDFRHPENIGEKNENFPVIFKGDHFKILNKYIKTFGIAPYSGFSSGDDSFNWAQCIAMHILTDPEIPLVFLKGGAGTGKTILALASALEQRRTYRQILVSRPMVHLEDKDNMGYLPGDIRDKMEPWLRPIWQNLSELKGISGENKQIIEKLLLEKKIEIEPLDYIRGTTFWRCLLIIDEAQNLTPHQVKTIITRAGEGSKIIFTGDLDQIDRKRRLDKNSSGLACSSERLEGQKIVASVKFKESVRSELAKIAVELL